VDFAFLALTAATLFVFRKRGAGAAEGARTPLHPWSTLFFIAVSLIVVGATFVQHPFRSLLGWTLVAAGWPVYEFWRRRAV
jgi:APA family basic amino acid/polyamine antiporter